MKVSACSVADCAQVAADVVERGWAAADRLFFVGGSHSGFIGAHLAGRLGRHSRCLFDSAVSFYHFGTLGTD